MSKGSVFQRHIRSCPRDTSGVIKPHKCRGRWAYSLFLGADGTGKRQQMFKSGFATKREAQTALDEVSAGDRLEAAAVRGLDVATFLEHWLREKRALRPTTRRGYESHVRLYLAPHLGRVMLAELRPHHLDRMYSALLRDDERGVATVHRIHSTLRSALGSAVRRRLIPWNPAVHVELPVALRPMTSVWTPKQLGEFLDSIVDDRLYALFHVIAFTGLRRGEALGLRWVDVNAGDGHLSVNQQLVDTGQGLAFGPPKTRESRRLVPLDAGTRNVLDQQRQSQEADRRAWGDAWINTGLVFTREDGQMLRPDSVTKLFQRLIQQAGLPAIRLHDLRHTSASLALAAGVPMKVVSQRLGHSTMLITADLYTHVVPELAREAADRIAAIVPRRTVSDD